LASENGNALNDVTYITKAGKCSLDINGSSTFVYKIYIVLLLEVMQIDLDLDSSVFMI